MFRSTRVEIFAGSYNFPDTHEILLFTSLAYASHVDTLPSSMAPKHFTNISTGEQPAACLL